MFSPGCVTRKYKKLHFHVDRRWDTRMKRIRELESIMLFTRIQLKFCWKISTKYIHSYILYNYCDNFVRLNTWYWFDNCNCNIFSQKEWNHYYCLSLRNVILGLDNKNRQRGLNSKKIQFPFIWRQRYFQ